MLNFKVLCIVSFFLVVLASAVPNVPGAPKQLSGDDLKAAESTLNKSLTKLAAGDGPHYTLSKINSASVQVVSGSLYKYNVDLEDKDKHDVKKCDVSIWSQPWLENGIEVTFKCVGEEKVVKKHSA